MIGAMRRQVRIQNRSIQQDSFGAVEESWIDQGVRMAEVVPLSSRELWYAAQIESNATHKCTLRYFAGLSPQHRFIIDNKKFEVSAVTNPDGRKRWHECTIVEVT
jgi:SPP1 family predicted phage head-tail adaptor